MLDCIPVILETKASSQIVQETAREVRRSSSQFHKGALGCRKPHGVDFFFKPSGTPLSSAKKGYVRGILLKKNMNLIIFQEHCVQLLSRLSHTYMLCAFMEFTMPFTWSTGIIEALKMKLLTAKMFRLQLFQKRMRMWEFFSM